MGKGNIGVKARFRKMRGKYINKWILKTLGGAYTDQETKDKWFLLKTDTT